MKFAIILILSILFIAIHATTINQEKNEQIADGHENNGKKQTEIKVIEGTSKKSAHDQEHTKKGETLKDHHKKIKEEKHGKKKAHHSSGGHKSSKQSGGESEHGAKFQDANKQKKQSYKKGFREKYHKDEHKKHDSFYSNGHKSGNYEVFGEKISKHNSRASLKKHYDNQKVAKNTDDYRKMWQKAGEHKFDEKKGHKDEKAGKSHHNRQQKWAKKGGKKGGKQYQYKIK